VILAEPVTRWFGRFTSPDPFLPRALLPRWRKLANRPLRRFNQGFAVSIAAWIGSLALLFWYFHLITPISLLANVVVVPIAFSILAVALLSILTAPLVPALSVLFNNANWFLAKLVIYIVHVFAA